MKKVVRLTESELTSIIRKVINEVKYGGVTLHGTDMGDWATMEKVRNDKGGKNTTPHWKRHRNYDNYSDVFRKNFGEYETDVPGKYQFPDEETYDKADNAIEQAVNKSFDKSREIGINTVPQEINVLHSWYDKGVTFYAKQLQSNGYYPITKFERSNDDGYYREFIEKSGRDGKYWGTVSLNGYYPDFNSIVDHFASINALISKEPFTNSGVYDGENNRVINTRYFREGLH